MPTTTNYGFYTPPLTGVTPNVARDMLTLADAIDVSLKAEETARIAADATVASSRLHTTGTSIPNNSQTVVNFNVSEMDGIAWDNTNSRFTVPTDGYYQINACVNFMFNATGMRSTRIVVNGTVVAAAQSAAASPTPFGTGPGVSRCKFLSAGDLVQIAVLQSSGGSLAMATASGYAHVDITRVGR